MDPTAEELAQITSVATALDWAGLGSSGAAADGRLAFLAAFGVAEEDAPRVLAIIPESDYQEAAKGIRIGGNLAPPGVVAKALLAARACRLACKAPTPSTAPVATAEVGKEGQQATPKQQTPPVEETATPPPTTAGAAIAPPAEDEESSKDKDVPMEDPVEVEKRRIREFEQKLNAMEAQKQQEAQDDQWDELDGRAGLGFTGASSPAQTSHAQMDDVDGRSAYVSGLDPATTPEEVEKFFKACGGIKRVTILVDKYTHQSKGAAYIEFSDAQSLENGLLLNGSILRNSSLKVVKKQEIPQKGKPKGKGKESGKGKPWKGKPQYSNTVYRPNQSNPY
mmetsp:Transcript_26662/g.48879  ORF Transcript_26662/g.48879 Transcript_26662/m.48879 type:complete len:337 (-) Transcript_26662:80-1090(-)